MIIQARYVMFRMSEVAVPIGHLGTGFGGYVGPCHPKRCRDDNHGATQRLCPWKKAGMLCVYCAESAPRE